MSALAKAVAALIEVDDTIEAVMENRLDAIDSAPSTDHLNALIRSIERLKVIQRPFPLLGPDVWRGLPSRRVEARAWAGIITNPGGFGGPGVSSPTTGGGRRRSVYLETDGADSHGVHYADVE